MLIVIIIFIVIVIVIVIVIMTGIIILILSVTKITKLFKLVTLGFQVDALSKKELHEEKINSVLHMSLLSFADRTFINQFISDSNKLACLDTKLRNIKISSNMKWKKYIARKNSTINE